MKFYANKVAASTTNASNKIDQKNQKETIEQRLLTFSDGRPVPIAFRRKPKEPTLLREGRRICRHVILYCSFSYSYEEIHHRTQRQIELEAASARGEITEIVTDYGPGFLGKLFKLPRAVAYFAEFLLDIMHPVDLYKKDDNSHSGAEASTADAKTRNDKPKLEINNAAALHNVQQNSNSNSKTSEPMLAAFPLHNTASASANTAAINVATGATGLDTTQKIQALNPNKI